MSRGSAAARSPGPVQTTTAHKRRLFVYGVVVRFSPEGGCFPRNHFKRSVSARFIAYEASSHRTSPRGSSWVQALPGKFRGNHNPGFDRGNFCPFPGAYLGSHTPGIPSISGSVSEVYPGPTRFGGSNGDALFPCVSCSLRETASATVEMGRRQCRLAGSGFPAGFALTGIERDHSSPRCAAAFLITETQFCREHKTCACALFANWPDERAHNVGGRRVNDSRS